MEISLQGQEGILVEAMEIFLIGFLCSLGWEAAPYSLHHLGSSLLVSSLVWPAGVLAEKGERSQDICCLPPPCLPEVLAGGVVPQWLQLCWVASLL